MSPSAAALPRRLRKFARDCSDLSLEQIAAALQQGRFCLWSAGVRVLPLEEDTLVYPSDVVTLDGAALLDDKPRRTFVFNKPKSVTTTMSDPRGKQDLQRFLAPLPSGVFPVGRLDRETTGALLLSNDGDLTSAVLRPEHHLKKVYWLWLNECVPAHDPRLLSWLDGMTVLGKRARADAVEVQSVSEDMSELLVTLSQGINRQIRRMCRASDFRLLHLHRRSVGPVALQGLGLGEVRELSAEELELLWAEAGGRERIWRVQLDALRLRVEKARQLGQPQLRLEDFLSRITL